jgi:hypothetical protein
LIDLLTVDVDAATADDDVVDTPLTDVAVGLRAVVPGWHGQGTDDDLVSAVEEAILSVLP